MSPTRLPAALVLVVFALAILRVFAAWDTLPPTMASHFGPSGRPDAHLSRGLFFGIYSVVGGGTCLLLLAIRWVLPRVPPSLINLPNRDYWLSPERRRDALGRLATWMDWFAAATAVFLFFVLELVLQANQGRAALATVPFLVGLLAYFAGTVGMLVLLYRNFRVPEDRGLE